MNLTRSQLDAIAHRDGHLQLLACAGSGKTEVVARRVVALLAPGAAAPLAPRNIVAFTFTDRAAAELKARIVRRVREAHGDVHGMAEMFVGTIHSFCIQLLQEEVPEFLRYSVLDESRQRMLVEREPERSGFAATRTLADQPLTPHGDTRRYLAALDVLRQGEVDRSRLGALAIGDALDRYRALLREESFLDYTAQLELAVDVLRRDIDAGQRLAARVKHVIVDEYQDTNSLQEQVVRALADFGATLTVVGDDDQTIFQWNGADVENILGFADRYPGSRQIRLEENFRSSAPIVTFARDFVAHIDRRLPKAMQATAAQPFERGDLLALSFANDWDEARFIARKLRELHGLAFTEGGQTRGLAWSDMAILMRGNLRWATSAMTRMLTEAGIPFVVTGVKTLFERAEVQAASALFVFLGGDAPDDAARLGEAWRTARLGTSEAALERTTAWLHEQRARLAAATGEDREGWRPLSLQRMFLHALDLLEVREERVPDGRGEEVFFNLGRFSRVLGEFESLWSARTPIERVRGVNTYVAKSARGEYEDGSQTSEYAGRDAVRITTVHRAKGLQWPVVFLPGMADGRFPMADKEQSLWELVPREVVRAPQRYENGEQDERRLFYVAATRAQKFIVASWAVGRYGKPRNPGEYFRAFAASPGVETADIGLGRRPRAMVAPRAGVTDTRLTFSQMKPMFECPYRFRLQAVYGFRAPLEEAQGFGKALHDALAEVHRRAIAGDLVEVRDIPRLLDRHVHLPYASRATFERLREAASVILSRYLLRRGARLDQIELAEKSIEVAMGDGVTVEGRIDVVYRRESGDVSIVDLKSDRRAQAEDLTEAQLRIYALGYEALSGQRPQRIEVWELDRLRESESAVDDQALSDIRAQVLEAARRVRTGDMPPSPLPERCATCATRAVCTARVTGESAAAPEAT